MSKLVIEWLPDFEPYELGDAESEMPQEVWGCIVKTDDGEHLCGVWSIADPSPEFAMSIESELIVEALAIVEARREADATFHNWMAL